MGCRWRQAAAAAATVLSLATAATAGCTPSASCNVAGTCADCSFRGVCSAGGSCVCEDGWGGGDNYGCAPTSTQCIPDCATQSRCTSGGGTWTGTTADSLACNFCASLATPFAAPCSRSVLGVSTG